MKEGTTSLGARAQSAIWRAAVLYKPRLATFSWVSSGNSPKNVYTAEKKYLGQTPPKYLAK
jgi:hypothetical protein